MKTKKGFTLRTVGDEHIIIAGGVSNVDFSKIVSLNESAARLWKEVEDKEFTASQLATLLTEWYEIDDTTALKDTEKLTAEWLQAGIIEP